jgi:hypothetical protein
MRKLFVLLLFLSSVAGASDCKVSLDFSSGGVELGAEGVVANSSLTIKEARFEIEQALARKGYEVVNSNSNSNSILKIAFASVDYQEKPKTWESVISVWFFSEGSSLSVNSTAYGFNSLQADKGSLRKSLRRILGLMDYCDKN